MPTSVLELFFLFGLFSVVTVPLANFWKNRLIDKALKRDRELGLTLPDSKLLDTWLRTSHNAFLLGVYCGAGSLLACMALLVFVQVCC